MSKSKPEISEEVNEYYDEIEYLLKEVGAYVRAVKFQANLNDPETNWKPAIQETFTKYYEGSYSKLESSIRLKRKRCFEAIDLINIYCRTAGVMQVRKPEKLFELLQGNKRRKFWRKAINMHRRQNEIVSLQQIEREYRSPF